MESINEKRGTNDIYYRCRAGTLIKLAADHEFYSIHKSPAWLIKPSVAANIFPKDFVFFVHFVKSTVLVYDGDHIAEVSLLNSFLGIVCCKDPQVVKCKLFFLSSEQPKLFSTA